MIKINNIFNNKNIVCIGNQGQYTILEHQHDMSVTSVTSEITYFMEKMNVKKRQVYCNLENSAIKMQAGAMQWISGDIEMNADVSGAKDFLGKMVKGAITGESAVKPVYKGSGVVMLEPTYNHIIIEDVSQWGNGIVLDDGLFLVCDAQLEEKIVKRNDLVSAVFGGEGLFNLSLSGNGYCVLETPVPREELFEFDLENDTLRIDGNMAIAWSSSLKFTVEQSTKSALGALASGEGFVNVFRGTGRVLMAPTITGTVAQTTHEPEQKTATTTSIIGSLFK